MKSILLLFLTGIVYTADAQQIIIPHEIVTDFNTFKYQALKTPKVKPVGAVAFNPADITVVDLRFDSSMLGFTNKPNAKNNKRLVLRNGTCSGVSQLLKIMLRTASSAQASPIELVTVVQKLWLSDNLLHPAAGDGAGSSNVPQKGIAIQVAYFLKQKDAYVPLLKFDSVFTGSRSVSTHGGEYLVMALSKSIADLKNVDANRVFMAGKKYSFSYIETVYKTRFDHPVLSGKPQKGVYKGFDEFLKNKPLINDFSIKSDSLYYIDVSGKEILCRDVFAISDGNDFYIRSSDKFYKLHRSGNTFNLLGAGKNHQKAVPGFIDPLFVPQSLLANAANFSTPVYVDHVAEANGRKKGEVRCYQLDMETGIFY